MINRTMKERGGGFSIIYRAGILYRASSNKAPPFRGTSGIMDNFSKILSNNKCWARDCV